VLVADTKQLPTRIKLLNWGVNESTEGPVIVNELTLSSFAAMQRRIGRERAPLDFEHNTVPGTPEYSRTQEPRAIAAMGTPVVVNGEGLFLESLSFTATGETLSHYEDVSAAPLLNKDRVVVGLHSAALTRTGAVYGAHFAAEDCLKLAGDGITLAAFASKISASLLGADASEQQTKNKSMTIEELGAQLVALKTDLDARLKAIEGKSPVDLAPLSARLDNIEAANKTAAQAVLDAEKNRILPLFASEGKVPKKADGTAYSADELKALDLPMLQVLHANTPVTVSTGSRKPAGEQKNDKLTGAARAGAGWSHLNK
jgi:hypothetical protein